MEDESKPVEWMVSVAHASYNLDAHNIIDRYEDLKIEFEEFETKTTKKILRLEKQQEKLKTEKEEALAHLKKLKDKVVNPLIEQVTAREKRFGELA